MDRGISNLFRLMSLSWLFFETNQETGEKEKAGVEEADLFFEKQSADS